MESTSSKGKIIITGASGLLGRTLLSQLKASGFRVSAAVRRPQEFQQGLPLVDEIIPWESSLEFPTDALKDAQAVVHLAGTPVGGQRWTREQKLKIRETRVLGTRRLVDAFNKLEAVAPLFISASAIGFYGDRGEQTLNENDTASQNDFLSEVCQQWEAEALKYKAIKNGPLNILRFGLVLDAKGGALGSLLPLFRKGLGGPLGSGQQWMSWIHIADVVRAIMHFIEKPHTPDLRGTFNIVSPQPVRNHEFATTLGAVLHRPSLIPVPAFAARLALGEMSTLALSSQKVSQKKLEQTEFKFLFPTLDSALRDLLG